MSNNNDDQKVSFIDTLFNECDFFVLTDQMECALKPFQEAFIVCPLHSIDLYSNEQVRNVYRFRTMIRIRPSVRRR